MNQEQELKIDEKYLQATCKNPRDLLQVIEQVLKRLEDKEEDVFIRYLDYHRISNFREMAQFIAKLTQKNIVTGSNLNDDFFNTEAHKEGEWHKTNLHEDMFFVNPLSETRLTESLLSLLRK